ncbi:hypothetical protein EXE52_13670 [Halorubrum sp. CGM4_25_10-8A]|nr:hypothetical protein EXE52_13670 [Halorubrum sp. CGM4_25_10-8A]
MAASVTTDKEQQDTLVGVVAALALVPAATAGGIHCCHECRVE